MSMITLVSDRRMTRAILAIPLNASSRGRPGDLSTSFPEVRGIAAGLMCPETVTGPHALAFRAITSHDNR